MTQEVIIKIGELGSEFQKRYPSQVKINKQPAGLDFYSIDWDARPRGTIKVEHGENSFVIEGALGLQTSIDLELPKEGFDSIRIYAGITDPDLISHDEARLKVYELLKKIEQAGWRTITSRSRPRLAGKDRLSYAINASSAIGLDLDYIPSLEEWMRIENLTEWSFYANKQFLNVYFKRESSLLDPNKPGSYLLTFTLTSEIEHFRGYAGPDNRAKWKEILNSQLDKLKPLRAQREAALQAQGIKIDEAYQDPPLPILK